MAVPNTDTFTLQDVKNELSSSNNDLVSFFAEAVDANFDPLYKGSKNSLLNFRNYGAEKIVTPLLVGIFSAASPQGSCLDESTLTQQRGWKHDISTGIPIEGDIIYANLSATTIFNGNDQYYKVDYGFMRLIIQISSTGVIMSTYTC